jgi:TRAP-type C4-dicarboxylate transport system substrate-binding protein
MSKHSIAAGNVAELLTLPEQQGRVQAAADEVNKNQPAKAIELEPQSQDKLKSIGVKIVPMSINQASSPSRTLPRQARQGTRRARREDQGPDPGD